MSAPPRLSKYMMKMDSMDALARTHSKRRAREDGKPWYIFYPDAKTVFARDMLSFCALLFSFVVVPFEVAFVDADGLPDPAGALWIINRLIDVVFVFDIFLEFLIAYEKPITPLLEGARVSSKEAQEFREVMSQMGATEFEFSLLQIFFSYLRGWLLLDLAALGPSTAEVYFAVAAAGLGSGNVGVNVTHDGTYDFDAAQRAALAARSAKMAKLVKLFRVRFLKLFRLLKLVKLVRAIKMFNDPEGPYQRLLTTLNLTFLTHARKLSIAKLSVVFVVLVHLQACLLGFSTVGADQRSQTWWGTLGYCFPERAAMPSACLESGIDDGGEECEEEKIPCVEPFHLYWVCVTWALEFNFGIPANVAIVKGPGTPIFPEDSNALFSMGEYIVFVVCAMVTAYQIEQGQQQGQAFTSSTPCIAHGHAAQLQSHGHC